MTRYARALANWNCCAILTVVIAAMKPRSQAMSIMSNFARARREQDLPIAAVMGASDGRGILAAVGNTPLIELPMSVKASGRTRLFAKLESVNPGGSIKD